jgi:hypothetical protein
VEVSAVPAPRFFVVRHVARFPREWSSEARKSVCSLLRMTRGRGCARARSRSAAERPQVHFAALSASKDLRYTGPCAGRRTLSYKIQLAPIAPPLRFVPQGKRSGAGYEGVVA